MKCLHCGSLIKLSCNFWRAIGARTRTCSESPNGKHEPEPTEAAPFPCSGDELHMVDVKPERKAVVGGQPREYEKPIHTIREISYVEGTFGEHPETPRPEMGKASTIGRIITKFLNERSLNGIVTYESLMAFAAEVISDYELAASGTESARQKDLELAAELLDEMYSKWENGAPCTSESDDDIGNAFRLGDREDVIIEVLNRLFPQTTKAQTSTLIPHTNGAGKGIKMTETIEQKKMDAILAAVPWRCFHCDFITSDHEEARIHFGDRDDAEDFKPICNWWASMSEDERLIQFKDALKALEREHNENDRQRVAIEGLEYQIDSIPQQIKSYKPFRQCNSIYDVFCVFDSMEGRALAAEEKVCGAAQSQKGGGE